MALYQNGFAKIASDDFKSFIDHKAANSSYGDRGHVAFFTSRLPSSIKRPHDNFVQAALAAYKKMRAV